MLIRPINNTKMIRAAKISRFFIRYPHWKIVAIKSFEAGQESLP
jgi:hypothetical protein